MAKTMEENPGQEDQIREFLNGFIKDGNAGIRLADKIGIFLHNSRNKGIELGSVRFYYRKNIFSLFIILEDPGDNQQYTLFLEYQFSRPGNRCTLENIYFSLVFSEKMKNLTEFFGSR